MDQLCFKFRFQIHVTITSIYQINTFTAYFLLSGGGWPSSLQSFQLFSVGFITLMWLLWTFVELCNRRVNCLVRDSKHWSGSIHIVWPLQFPLVYFFSCNRLEVPFVRIPLQTTEHFWSQKPFPHIHSHHVHIISNFSKLFFQINEEIARDVIQRIIMHCSLNLHRPSFQLQNDRILNWVTLMFYQFNFKMSAPAPFQFRYLKPYGLSDS